MHAQFVADAALRERFAQEAKMGGRIESEHVVDVVAAGIDAGTGMPWLAMELLEGEPLAEAVAHGSRRRPQKPRRHGRERSSGEEPPARCQREVHSVFCARDIDLELLRRAVAKTLPRSRMARGNAAVCGGRTEGTRGCQLRELLARLAEHQKRFSVIGGVALIARGVQRSTEDLDIA